MDRENKGAGKNRAVFAESNWADTFSATHHFLLFTALWVADPSVFVFPWLCEYGWVAYLCMFACVWLIEVDRCWQLRRITFLLVKHHIDPVAPPKAEVSYAEAQQAEWEWHPVGGWRLHLNPQHYTGTQGTLDTDCYPKTHMHRGNAISGTSAQTLLFPCCRSSLQVKSSIETSKNVKEYCCLWGFKSSIIYLIFTVDQVCSLQVSFVMRIISFFFCWVEQVIY